MKLNFYFEFPFWEPDAEDPRWYSNTTHLISSGRLYRLCKEVHPEIEFKAINSYFLTEQGRPGPKGNYGPACKYSHFYLIIENPDTKKYFTISYWDKLRGMCEGTFWDMENCVEVFAALGIQDNEIDYRPADIKYTPISCMSLHKDLEDKITLLYDKPKITPTNLFFKGGLYGIREYLASDPRFTIENNRVVPVDFIETIAPYSINIDINGAAEISCRSLDIMGLRSALIRPKLSIQYHNELIPDYHYASLRCDDLGNWKDVADAYVERFEGLKKNPEEVEFLATNGRQWYLENGTIDAHVKILKKVINFDKLK